MFQLGRRALGLVLFVYGLVQIAASQPFSSCYNASKTVNLPVATFCSDSEAHGKQVILDGYFAHSLPDKMCTCLADYNVSSKMFFTNVNYLNSPIHGISGCGSSIRISQGNNITRMACSISGSFDISPTDNIEIILLKNQPPKDTRYCAMVNFDNNIPITIRCFSNNKETTIGLTQKTNQYATYAETTLISNISSKYSTDGEAARTSIKTSSLPFHSLETSSRSKSTLEKNEASTNPQQIQMNTSFLTSEIENMHGSTIKGSVLSSPMQYFDISTQKETELVTNSDITKSTQKTTISSSRHITADADRPTRTDLQITNRELKYISTVSTRNPKSTSQYEQSTSVGFGIESDDTSKISTESPKLSTQTENERRSHTFTKKTARGETTTWLSISIQASTGSTSLTKEEKHTENMTQTLRTESVSADESRSSYFINLLRTTLDTRETTDPTTNTIYKVPTTVELTIQTINFNENTSHSTLDTRTVYITIGVVGGLLLFAVAVIVIGEIQKKHLRHLTRKDSESQLRVIPHRRFPETNVKDSSPISPPESSLNSNDTRIDIIEKTEDDMSVYAVVDKSRTRGQSSGQGIDPEGFLTTCNIGPNIETESTKL